jgi:hypothetical protein
VVVLCPIHAQKAESAKLRAISGTKYGLCDFCGEHGKLVVIKGFGELCKKCVDIFIRMLETANKSATIEELLLAFKEGQEMIP